MTRPQVLTLPKIKKAALRYYKAGRLIAQGSRMAGYFRDKDGRRCAIAASFTDSTIKRVLRTKESDSLTAEGIVRIDKAIEAQIEAITAAHEDWCKGKCDEKPLLELLQ